MFSSTSRFFLSFFFFLVDIFHGSAQDEEIEEFMHLLESPLYDVELRKLSAAKWLAQCEQVLQEAVELLDPSTSSGLVIACSGSYLKHSSVVLNAIIFNGQNLFQLSRYWIEITDRISSDFLVL